MIVNKEEIQHQYLPLAEVVDLGGRGEVAERVQCGAEAEQDVGVVGAR